MCHMFSWSLIKTYIKDHGLKIVFLIIGLYLLCEANFTLISKDYWGAVIFFTASIVLFVFAFLSKFKKFKAFGFEGELWDDKQKEAGILIDKLKSLSFHLSKAAYLSLGGIGRFAGSVPIVLVFENINSIDNTLRELGASQEEIIKIRAPFDRLIIYDIARPIWRQIEKDIDKKSEELQTIDEKGVAFLSKEHNDLIVKEKSCVIKIFSNHSETNEDLFLRIKNYFSESKIFDMPYYENLKNVCFLDFKNLESYIKNRAFFDRDYFLKCGK